MSQKEDIDKSPAPAKLGGSASAKEAMLKPIRNVRVSA